MGLISIKTNSKRLRSIRRFDKPSKHFCGRPAASRWRRQGGGSLPATALSRAACFGALLAACLLRCSLSLVTSTAPLRFHTRLRPNPPAAAPPCHRWPGVCGAGSVASSRSRPRPGSAPQAPPGLGRPHATAQACGGLDTGLLPRPADVSAPPPLCVTRKQGSTNAFCRCMYTVYCHSDTHTYATCDSDGAVSVTRHFPFCGRRRGEGELGGLLVSLSWRARGVALRGVGGLSLQLRAPPPPRTPFSRDQADQDHLAPTVMAWWR